MGYGSIPMMVRLTQAGPHGLKGLHDLQGRFPRFSRRITPEEESAIVRPLGELDLLLSHLSRLRRSPEACAEV